MSMAYFPVSISTPDAFPDYSTDGFSFFGRWYAGTFFVALTDTFFLVVVPLDNLVSTMLKFLLHTHSRWWDSA